MPRGVTGSNRDFYRDEYMQSEIFSGVIPALMTPCTADRTPDFDALVRKARELVAAGMSAVV